MTAGDTDIVDSNSVDRDCNHYGIVGDTLATDEMSGGMGMDIVDSVCMGIDDDAPATKGISRNMNVVDSYMHICVNVEVNVHVYSRAIRVVGDIKIPPKLR